MSGRASSARSVRPAARGSDQARVPRARPWILCVGGLDPSGGAGVLADLRAARAAGARARIALGALTAQRSDHVFAVRAVPPGFVQAQIAALASETPFRAVKSGLLASAGSVLELARWLARPRAPLLVLDPVLASGGGTVLMGPAARRALERALLPLACLVTPNLAEAAALSGAAVRTESDMLRAARAIVARGAGAVLVKGGHLPGLPGDLLWDGAREQWFHATKRAPGRWHGLGCHLASAIAARLALGDPLPAAVRRARRVLARGMAHPETTPSGRKVPRWGMQGSA